MSARTHVADALKAGLPAYRVYPHAVSPDGVSGIAIAVERTSVEPGVSQGLWTEEVTVYVLTGHEDLAKAEDALDDALDAVLAVLDNDQALSFVRAERSSIENHHGYSVTISLQTQHT